MPIFHDLGQLSPLSKHSLVPALPPSTRSPPLIPNPQERSSPKHKTSTQARASRECSHRMLTSGVMVVLALSDRKEARMYGTSRGILCDSLRK